MTHKIPFMNLILYADRYLFLTLLNNSEPCWPSKAYLEFQSEDVSNPGTNRF